MTTDIQPLYDQIKILVVDDEESSNIAFAKVIGRLYRVLQAQSAQEGLKVLEQNPDTAVVVSDQRMPRTSGVEFLFHVKNTYPAITRVLITGYADLDAAIDAINLGTVYKYIFKPFDPEKTKELMMDAVSYHLQMKQDSQLKNQTMHAIQKNTAHALEGYTGWIAHHVNNALQSVTTYVDLSAPVFGTDPTKKEFAKLTQGYVRRVGDIIKTLHDIFSTSLKRFVKAPLAALLEFENEELKKAIAAKKIVIKKRAPDPQLEIMADPEAIHEVIRRLVQNSVEASSEGATIEVSAAPHQSDGHPAVMFEVKDHGCGIPRELKDKLFFPFLKAGDGENLRGLGLPYVHAVVARHGGDIHVDSTVGKGTVVSFSLPIIQPEKEDSPLDRQARKKLNPQRG